MSLVHHRFTVDEYEQMIETGVLTEDDRVELIRGEIVEKMPIGDRHAACVNRSTRLFVRLLGDRAIVAIQNPIRLDGSEPEPDVAILRPRDDFYASGKPAAADVLLLIEVADTSLAFDRETKRALYAAAGIAEYWILNLLDESLEIHRGPRPDGTYAEITTHPKDGVAEPLAQPGTAVAVAEMLGA